MERRRCAAWPGGVALGVTVALWASFALTVRGTGASGLTSLDVAFLRFGTPVLLLAPWLPRAWRAVRREPGGVVLVLCAAGLPHFLLSELGGSLTSAALVGLLIPGSVPLFLAALLFARRRERVAPRRLLALGAILVGVAATTVLTTSPGSLAGIGALLAAGCAWAVYTLGLRRTGLDPVGVVLVVCVPSALAAGALGLTGLLPSHLLDGTAPLPAVGLFVVLQGVGTGIVSTLSYAYAVRRLGSSTSATTGALSPVLATVAAVPLFGEPITGGTVVALLFIVGGVVAGNLPPGRRTSRVAGPAGAPSAAVPTPT